MEFHSLREGKYSFPKNLQRDHYPAHALILDSFIKTVTINLLLQVGQMCGSFILKSSKKLKGLESSLNS